MVKFQYNKNEKVSVFFILFSIVLVTIFAFSAEFVIGQTATVLAGLGIVAYFLGLHHGIDADHIAAIDNVTRKLMQDGKRPLTVGLWFSLGHSTIVISLIIAIIFATRLVVSNISALQNLGAVLGAAISGSFLWVIGLLNAIIAIEVYKLFHSLRKGKVTEMESNRLLDNNGFMSRFFKPLFKMVNKPWHIYPVGLLFGLGFDTASEVALIAISVGIGASENIPIYYLLVLPLLFTCGMATVDTVDGIAMVMAYRWAFQNPLRKIYYNLTITITSVIVAWGVGSIELLQIMSSKLELSGIFWQWLNSLDFEIMGLGIIAIFALAWTASFGYWKYKKYDSFKNS